MNRISLLLFSGLALAACSQTYEVHTNVDPKNIEDYFKPSQVQQIEPDSIPEGAKTLAAITGSSCQANAADKPANLAEARTQAKIAVAELGATTLVIDVCETEINTESPLCLELLTCYGRALQLPETKKP